MKIRKSSERGRADHGWARSAYSFCFGDYFDIAHQGHGSLVVLNEDAIAPGKGFASHDHRDMEVVSYVLAGELAHRDDLGNVRTMQAGDVQRMSAGTGVVHSEFNQRQDRPVHLLQMWFEPVERGVPPGYEQKNFSENARRGRLALVVSPSGIAGSVSINTDASIEAGLFDGDEALVKPLAATRLTYVHLARGELAVNGVRLSAGDGALLDTEDTLSLRDGAGAEVLVFDLGR
jgi:redox-sensitive bicupin YhaK (pirin superfamily)